MKKLTVSILLSLFSTNAAVLNAAASPAPVPPPYSVMAELVKKVAWTQNTVGMALQPGLTSKNNLELCFYLGSIEANVYEMSTNIKTYPDQLPSNAQKFAADIMSLMPINGYCFQIQAAPGAPVPIARGDLQALRARLSTLNEMLLSFKDNAVRSRY